AAIGACVALGARAIAVVSSAAKAAYVRSIGADAVIVHTSEDFVARVKELTGGKGADRVVDVVGGETLARSIDAAARGGHIVLVGSLGGSAVTLSAGKIVARWLTLSGSTLRPQSAATKAAIAEGLRRDLWPALGEGRIRPPRIRALPLEQASRAHAEMEKREHFGKLILLTDYGRSLADADNSIELA
ncbi:MAG TPA: zinc-binding dehydrogenase, partial [Alphaproteobacteria bacterium]|nr:zinc-binding dehydrogenase [Alphaproteobacteria bacterium]